jgi:hypothetical protein
MRPFLVVCSVVAVLAALLVVYSQTWSFAWDEGFHLLAAQLIAAGKTPYLDFCFPQTPLNTYWNAGWMRMLGETWRVPHALAALLTAGAVLMTADFVLARFPVPGWKLAGALFAACAVALNETIFQYGTVAQAYGMGLFLTVAAFRLTILAVDRRTLLVAALAGFLASCAAASTLLTAAAAPVLLIWIFFCDRTGNRWGKVTAFAGGAAVPFLPILWLFARAPRAVFFNLIQYNTVYRTVDWPDATQHDMEVFTSWIDSSQALTLGLLAIAGVVFLAKSEWSRPRRAEFYLCGWLALFMGLEVCTPHPTFQRYFLFTVPFLGILAATGLYAVSLRLFNPDRPKWPVTVLIVLIALGLGKSLYERRTVYKWTDLEQTARKVDQVTPPNGTVWANEQIYFLTRRAPPSGMEVADSHRFAFSPAVAAALHTMPEAELERRVKAGVYDTVATYEDDDTMNKLGLPRLYAHKAEVVECTIFWDRVRRPATVK